MSVKCEESSTKNGIRVENDFEKNYPKNILLPMLEYLEEVGYRLSYEQCVGPRREL